MRNRRPAFTLIELITVIAIILVLAGMIVGVVVSGNNKQASAQGATAIVGWCKTAQAYALRDQKAYGVRFDFTSTHLVSGAQYIEQPFDWIGPVGSTITSVSATGGSTATITAAGGVDFTGGGTNPIQAKTASQLGDYLECNGGKIGEITTVTATGLTINLWSPDAPAIPANGWNFTGCSDWRIVRQPRAMIGADMIALPANVALDLDTSNLAPPAPQYKTNLPIRGNQLDILFAPNGSVIGNPGMIRLWVRDTSLPVISPGVFQGSQFIVNINGMTGMVGIQPVNTTMSGGFYGTPYSFTQDGKSGGY